jgi:hypothetical protein
LGCYPAGGRSWPAVSLEERYTDIEQRLLAEAGDTLPALDIARRATGALAEQIDGAQTPPLPDDPTPEFYVREAILVLAVIGLRTARACMLVVSAGYWPESHTASSGGCPKSTHAPKRSPEIGAVSTRRTG